ncbi:MAG TPA: hypothetical protein DDW52_06950 [Planctomycetaceae bacterium]|nr:hypothetical protein [Planctomycetaceae bacterium]
MRRVRFDREPESQRTPARSAARSLDASRRTQPDLARRIEEPVLIGATMVELLKSYGITDEEIAAGVAAYAARTRSAVA